MTRASPTHTWQVPVDHPALRGHFPGRPILPGVVLLDVVLAKLAAAGIATACHEIRSAKFLSPANPGDTLAITFAQAAGGLVRFEILCGTRKIASGDLATLAHGAASVSP